MRELKFSFLLQHDEMGSIVERVFSFANIFNGTAKDEIDKLGRYAVIARREYTGLKDKLGKEMYERDVVWEGIYDQHTGKKIASVVDFQNYGYVLVPLSVWTDLEYAGGGYRQLTYTYPVKYEIIGNIYETSSEVTL